MSRYPRDTFRRCRWRGKTQRSRSRHREMWMQRWSLWWRCLGTSHILSWLRLRRNRPGTRCSYILFPPTHSPLCSGTASRERRRKGRLARRDACRPPLPQPAVHILCCQKRRCRLERGTSTLLVCRRHTMGLPCQTSHCKLLDLSRPQEAVGSLLLRDEAWTACRPCWEGSVIQYNQRRTTRSTRAVLSPKRTSSNFRGRRQPRCSQSC
mmetsp:Transcript_28743/g.61144  ORF Transcript_28743/g.61144 Transcript_28743/m.61144 type:complete len:209 (-) Transcript_28743:1177-1803(-)